MHLGQFCKYVNNSPPCTTSRSMYKQSLSFFVATTEKASIRFGRFLNKANLESWHQLQNKRMFRSCHYCFLRDYVLLLLKSNNLCLLQYFHCKSLASNSISSELDTAEGSSAQRANCLQILETVQNVSSRKFSWRLAHRMVFCCDKLCPLIPRSSKDRLISSFSGPSSCSNSCRCRRKQSTCERNIMC